MALTPARAQALQAKRLKEPIPLAPFLQWCAARQAMYATASPDYDADSNEMKPVTRLLADIGWEGEANVRRLYRWRNETIGDTIERATIEDALDRAGVSFYDVYPDLEPTVGELCNAYCPACRRDTVTSDDHCGWCGGQVVAQRSSLSQYRIGQNRKMTDDQLRAAHVIYERTGRSIRQVADLIYLHYGYASNESCATSLRHGWKNLGLARRDVAEANAAAHTTHGMTRRGHRAPHYKRTLNIQRYGQCQRILRDGTACPRAAKPGSTACGYHHPDEIARRRAILAQVNAEGKNTLRWAGHRKAAA